MMIDQLMERVFKQLTANPNGIEWKQGLMDLYNHILQNPENLKDVYNCNLLGKFLLMVIERKIITDTYHLDKVANLSYLFLSIGTKRYPEISDVARDMILLINRAEEYLVHTIDLAKPSGNEISYLIPVLSQSSSTKKIRMIESYYFSLDPNIKSFSNYFSVKWNDLQRYFDNDLNDAITKGKKIDQSVHNWLEWTVLENEDLEF